jgi:hypothetical protein
MILLDENIPQPEQEKLQQRKIHCKKIGRDIGRQGLKDANDVVPLLHQLKGVTFFSRDVNFYNPNWRHKNYSLIFLDVNGDVVAHYIAKLLKHREFNTIAKRLGKVIRVAPARDSYPRAISFVRQLDFNFLRPPRRILQGFDDVIDGQARVGLHNALGGITRCDKSDNHTNRNSRAANARFAAHHGRIERYV